MATMAIYSCVFAIPSVCTSGVALSFKEYDFRRKYFIHFFLIRFVLSSILSTMYLVVSGNILQTSLIVTIAVLSLSGALRIQKLLEVEAATLSLNNDLLNVKLQESE